MNKSQNQVRWTRFAWIAMVLVMLFSMAAPRAAFAQDVVPTIVSDKLDYAPSELVTLTGQNWQGDTRVHILVNDDYDDPWILETDSEVDPYVQADGSIVFAFNLPSWFIASYTVTATGIPSGRIATTTFTDAAPPSIENLFQCDPPSVFDPATYTCVSSGNTGWVTGNNDGPLFEGDTVPYRTRFQNLIVGDTYSVLIGWDTTKASKHALDYLKSFNATITGADPCVSLTGLPAGLCSGAPSTYPIPPDTFMQSDANWIANGAVQEPGVFTMYGGTITGLDPYINPVSYVGDTATKINIYFTANSTDIVLAWGGHIATRADWGLLNSAVSITGSPYHMHIDNWKDETNDKKLNVGVMDRSLSAEAVIYPAYITIIKQATPEGATPFPFTTTLGLMDPLVDDGTVANTKVFEIRDATQFIAHTITENIPTGWSLDNVVCTDTSGNPTWNGTNTITVNVAEGDNITCTFYNERQVGNLEITKVVNWNGVTPDTTKTFEICIQGPSYPAPATNCKAADFDGAVLSWTNLIAGSYTVTETNPGSEWSVSIVSSPVNVPSDGGTASVTVTNTRKLAGLEITKVVNWNGVTPDTTKTFEICIQGPSYPAPATNCKTADFDGAVLSWTNLIAGSYTVTETNPGSEWSVSIVSSPVNVPSDGGTASVTVTNTRKLAGLEITKVVNWNGVTPDTTKTFEICIQGPSYPAPATNCKTADFDGAVLSWTNLIAGSYTVTETNPGSEWSVSIVSSPVNVPSDGGTASVTVTNTRKLAGLEITKVVNWNGVTPDTTKTFEICIQGPSYPAPATNCKTADFDGAVLSWTNLIAGSYIVTETNPGGEWSVSIVSSPVSVPADGGTASVTVTNTRKLAGLEITKVVNWNGVTPDTTKTFEICIQGPSYPAPATNCKTADFDGAVLSWTNLIAGSYTVTETNPGSEWSVSIVSSPVNVPSDGGTASVTVTNTRKLAGLEITKVVNWNGVTPDTTKTFEICIQGPSYPAPATNCKTADFDGAVLSWTNLIAGSYIVTETNPGSEWSVSIVSSPVSVPADGGTASVTVTNTRKLAGLEITKVVNWNGVTPDTTKTFEICIQGPSYPAPATNCKTADFDGAVLSWTNLIAGSYTVTETNPGSEWSVSIVSSPVNVPSDGGTASVTVTNTRKLAGLEITKVVNWNGVTPDTTKTFEICIQGPSYPAPATNCKTADFDGAVLSWTNLIAGSYTVTETNPGSEWSVSIVSSPVNVPSDGGTASVTVTNTRKLAGLEITKVVNWNGVTPDTTKTFEICIQGPSYPAPATNCKTADFDGAVLSWTNLIAGSYTVTETNPGSEWSVSIVSSPVNVPSDGGTASVTVTNTRKLAGLEITKVVNWNGVTPDTTKTFEICIQGPSYPAPATNCKTADFDGAVLSWTNLIAGSYTVTETNPGSEWSVSIVSSPVNVPSDGGTASVTVTNTRKLAGLEITKVVNWNGVTPDTTKTFEICIQGPSYPAPATNCKTADFDGAVLSWTNLIAGSYIVTETNPGSEWSVSIVSSPVNVPSDGGTASVTVTNTRTVGTIIVDKVTIPSGSLASFEFNPSWSDANFFLQDASTPHQVVLGTGAYSVVELAKVGWRLDSAVCVSSIQGKEQSPAAINLADGETVTCTFTNEQLGSLQVTKNVDWALAIYEPDRIFTICIQGPTFPLGTEDGACKDIGADGGVLLWENLLPGSYIVTEENPGGEWLVTYVGTPAEVVPGGLAEAIVTNRNTSITAVTLKYFVKEWARGMEVKLAWATIIEVDNLGFEIFRSTINDFQTAESIGFVASQVPGGTGAGRIYGFLDSSAPVQGQYYYWLVDISNAGQQTVEGDPLKGLAVMLLEKAYFLPQLSK